MTYAEIVVNVPIRRTFSRRYQEPPPSEDIADVSQGDDDGAGALQTYHYHVPPDLDGELKPGHLVWVPFGAREVQGFVVRLSDTAPVETKAVLRLARTEPVLTPVQLALAEWISRYYVAPASETLRLFLPPGILAKEDGSASARVKREELIEWVAEDLSQGESLSRLGRDTYPSQVYNLLLDSEAFSPASAMTKLQIRDAVGRQAAGAVRNLVDRGDLAQTPADESGESSVYLDLGASHAEDRLYELRGVQKYVPVIDYLRRAGSPVWKSDLYQEANADLKLLRELRSAGLISMTQEVHFRDPLRGRTYARTVAPPFTNEQQAVWTQILRYGFEADDSADAQGPNRKFLIRGVTGSGKTEVYLRAIEAALERRRQAIVLVPEISLTPQTVARFAGRFPGRVTVIHSGLSTGERYDVWRMIRNDEYDVVVGPRSALFAPLKRLGLIVVDEEHEPSYKQDAESWGSYKVFYDARSAAIRLAELSDSVLIFGSATPSLERFYAAQRGRMHLLEMPHRIVGHGIGAGASYLALPPVEVVDMRAELHADNRSVLSRSLQAELLRTLDAHEQAILFLNRRGTSTFVICRDCGYVANCGHCSSPLIYHQHAHTLICHQCNKRYPIPDVCPVCNSKRIKYFGAGTQAIEESVRQFAPGARVLRWDADTTRNRGSHEEFLERFLGHEADVLVGTQMIAKGLDLPLVTLVGVVAADVALHLPDFRAGERTFQLLTQVAGRAGRGMTAGRVIFQTYSPDHYAVRAAASHDYVSFYRKEIAYREEMGYPPIQRMARLIVWERSEEKAQSMAEEMAQQLQFRIAQLDLTPESYSLIGPTPAFFTRVRGNYRWQIILRYDDPAAVLGGMSIPFGWRVDVDPVTVL